MDFAHTTTEAELLWKTNLNPKYFSCIIFQMIDEILI